MIEQQQYMQRAVERLSARMVGIRTGRAAPTLLQGITVGMIPLHRMASVTVENAQTLVIHPWEVSDLALIEKAIGKSGMGLTPRNDGRLIRLTLPRLTTERRRELQAQINRMAEEARVEVRQRRREMLKSVKGSESERDRESNQIQKLTDQCVALIDRLAAKKIQEILTE